MIAMIERNFRTAVTSCFFSYTGAILLENLCNRHGMNVQCVLLPQWRYDCCYYSVRHYFEGLSMSVSKGEI